MTPTDEQIDRVTVALIQACLKEYGSLWSNPVAKAFALAALEAMDNERPIVDRKQATMLAGELGKVRCWLTGYEAGRADKFTSIPGIDSLRMVQQFLKDLVR